MVKLRRENLVQAMMKELRQMIENGELGPGEQLPSQDTLAEEFGVSRSTVREAVQGLRSLGLVEIHPGRGSYLCEDPKGILALGRAAAIRLKEIRALEVYEARFVLERGLAGLAAEKANEDQVGQIREALEGLRQKVGNAKEFARQDLNFHLKVAQAADNPLLEQFYHISHDLLEEMLNYVCAIPGIMKYHVGLHEAIAQGIEEGDPDAAMAAVDVWKKQIQRVLRTHGVDANDQRHGMAILEFASGLDVDEVQKNGGKLDDRSGR